MASGQNRSGRSSSRSSGDRGSTRASSSRTSGSGSRTSSRSGSSSSRSGITSGSRSSGSRNGSSSSSASRRPKSSENIAASKVNEPSSPAEVSFGDYLHAFTKTKAFKPVLVLGITFIVVLLDLLVSWNRYDLFFKILGFEIIIVGVIYIFSLIMNMSTTLPSSRQRNEDEE